MLLQKVFFGTASLCLCMISWLAYSGVQFTQASTKAVTSISLAVNGDPNSDTRDGSMPLRELVLVKIAAIPGAIVNKLVEKDGLLERQFARLEEDLLGDGEEGRRLGAVQDLVSRTDQRVGEIIEAATVERELEDGRTVRIPVVQALYEDLSPTLDKMNTSAASFSDVAGRLKKVSDENLECKGNGNCWPAGITAALGGVKMATGEAGQTMRRIDSAIPSILDNFEKIGNNSDKITAETALGQAEYRVILSNLKKSTEPLPKWARYTFGVGAVVAPIASAVVGALAAIGFFGN